MQEELKPDVKNEKRRSLLGASAAGVAALALGAKAGGAQPQPGASELPIGKEDAVAGRFTEREITYRSGDAEMKAFRVDPMFYVQAVPRPKAAIIIIHEIWGLNAHIRDVARRFARQGYIAIAPDLYSREGAPKLDVGNRPALMEFVASLNDTRIVGDLEAAIVHLNAEGVTRVGSMGFCMGGLYSYLLACKSEKLQAAVDFYGRIAYPEKTANKPETPLELASQLKCPLLCHFGETDASIPVADVEKLQAALAGSTPGRKTPAWKINLYPGAGHAFFNDTRPAYHAPSAADAGTETLRFFQKHLQKS